MGSDADAAERLIKVDATVVGKIAFQHKYVLIAGHIGPADEGTGSDRQIPVNSNILWLSAGESQVA